MIDLSSYYSGGYFLIRANKPDWPQFQQTDLLPEKPISLSCCICPQHFTVTWGVRSGDIRDALKFGIPESKLDEYADWCYHTRWSDALDFPSIFYSPNAAQQVVERFRIDTNGLYLIGAGLHKSEAEHWNQITEPEFPGNYLSVNPLFQTPSSPDDFYGTERFVYQRQPLASGGMLLGFEVVSFSYQSFGHTWYCNHTAEELGTLFGIQPGRFGLIETQHEAQKVFDWIAEDKQRGGRAEPEPYAYWLLVSYPLTS